MAGCTCSAVAGIGARGGRCAIRDRASEPIGSPSIRRGLVWDLYASVIGLQDNGDSATFRFYRNPGVNWLWVGGALMALGGAAAGWPTRSKPTQSQPTPPGGARAGRRDDLVAAGIR